MLRIWGAWGLEEGFRVLRRWDDRRNLPFYLLHFGYVCFQGCRGVAHGFAGSMRGFTACRDHGLRLRFTVR